MINEDMIKRITSEVIARIKRLEAENCNINRKKILIVEEREKLCTDLLSQLTNENFIIESIEDCNDVTSYDAIVLQGIDNTEIVNLSLGIGSSRKEKIVIESLFKGKKVYSIDSGTEYRKYVDTAIKSVYSLFRSYEEKLKTYGISFIGLKDLSERIINNNDISQNVKSIENCEIKNQEVLANDNVKTESQKYYDLSDIKLLTETKLKDIIKNKTMGVVISKKTIITPAAADYLRTNKLYVKTI